VAYTLDLLNGTLLPGNYQTTSCNITLAEPANSIAIPQLNELVVLCDNEIALVNLTTNQFIASVPVGISPTAAVFDGDNGDIYVTNFASGTVTVIAGSNNSVLKTILVTGGPIGICYDSASKNLYVADYNFNRVSVISTVSNTVSATIQTGRGPERATYDPANGEIYVTNYLSENVTVISGSTSTFLTSISVEGFPWGSAYDPANGDIYVGDAGTKNISVISGSNNTVIDTIPLEGQPISIAYDSGNGDFYVAEFDLGKVCILSGTNYSVVTTVSVGSQPGGVDYDPANGNLYVTNWLDNNVSVISDSSNLVTDIITLEYGPTGIGYNSANGDLYVADTNTSMVQVVSGSGSTVMRTIPLGHYLGPVAIACDSSNGDVYAANSYSGNVSVIRSSTNTVIKNVSVGTGPVSLQYVPATGDIYVVNVGSDNLTVISGGNNSVAGAIPVQSSPDGIAYDEVNGNIYVSEYGSSNVTVINATGNNTVSNIHLDGLPVGLSYDRGNGYLYAAVSNSISVIDPANNRVIANLSLGTTPDGLVTDSANGYVYAANPGYNNITVISGTSVLGSISVGLTPTQIAFDPDNGYLYVTNSGGNSISIVSTSISDPPLVSVTVVPSARTLPQGASAPFAAVPMCTGAGCPSGIAYSWSLTNNFDGLLSSITGPSIVFTALDIPGNVSLFVNATLDGLTVMSAPVTIEITSTGTSLVSVAMNPATADVSVGGSQIFAAVPTCSLGSCPASIAYSWSLTSGLGSLNSSSGTLVSFQAGGLSGSVTLFLNASLNGTTRQSVPAQITISSVLSYVGSSPSVAHLTEGQSRIFNATPTCTGGPCLGSISYQWSINNALGELNSTTGTSVELTAGTAAGTLSLFVNATQDGTTVHGSPSTVTIVPMPGAVLVGLTLSNTTTTLSPGQTKTYSATPSCLPSPCPSVGISYSWTLSYALGSLSSTVGPSTTFTAGSTGGVLTLIAAATLNGTSLRAYATIHITTSSTNNPTFLGLPGYDGYILLAAIVVVVVVAALWIIRSVRGKEEEESEGKDTRTAPPLADEKGDKVDAPPKQADDALTSPPEKTKP
jgi:YVTN family beta-propeller protein